LSESVKSGFHLKNADPANGLAGKSSGQEKMCVKFTFAKRRKPLRRHDFVAIGPVVKVGIGVFNGDSFVFAFRPIAEKRADLAPVMSGRRRGQQRAQSCKKRGFVKHNNPRSGAEKRQREESSVRFS
jgi:hypothetical protein